MHSREEYMEHEHIWLQDLFFALKVRTREQSLSFSKLAAVLLR
jgi:hypothetical protein